MASFFEKSALLSPSATPRTPSAVTASPSPSPASSQASKKTFNGQSAQSLGIAGLTSPAGVPKKSLHIDTENLSSFNYHADDRMTVEKTDRLKAVFAMAPAYVRLWLALKELLIRDPHPSVWRAVLIIIEKFESKHARKSRHDSMEFDNDYNVYNQGFENVSGRSFQREGIEDSFILQDPKDLEKFKGMTGNSLVSKASSSLKTAPADNNHNEQTPKKTVTTDIGIKMADKAEAPTSSVTTPLLTVSPSAYNINNSILRDNSDDTDTTVSKYRTPLATSKQPVLTVPTSQKQSQSRFDFSSDCLTPNTSVKPLERKRSKNKIALSGELGRPSLKGTGSGSESIEVVRPQSPFGSLFSPRRWLQGSIASLMQGSSFDEFGLTSTSPDDSIHKMSEFTLQALLESTLYESSIRQLLAPPDTCDLSLRKVFSHNNSIGLTGNQGQVPSDSIDLLSNEATETELRAQRKKATASTLTELSEKFDVLNESTGIDSDHYYTSGGMRTSLRSPAATIAAKMQFHEKAILKTDSSRDMISAIRFHAFEDCLVVAMGHKLDVWSLRPQTRLTQVTESNKLYGGAQESAKITCVDWINESYANSLLMTGSEDGSVRVWRDVLTSRDSDALSDTPELCAAFAALPDIDNTIRGSGLVSSWNQKSGVLVAGGNSQTVRLWDLSREQCVRAFDTGMGTCLTAMASDTVSKSFPPVSKRNTESWMLEESASDSVAQNTWLFTGFADGSIAVFDERCGTNGGRVASYLEKDSWIVHAHLVRGGGHAEVVTGSSQGIMRFWDIRKIRFYKSLVVQKSPLTAMTVHNNVPIVGCGSQYQCIKIISLGGELMTTIRYFDGFMRQSIGVVSSLAFHPLKMTLAAGNVDGVVSIYSTW